MKLEYTYWEDGEDFVGFLREFPDYWTQGASLEDLEEHLRDLFRDLSGGEIAGIRRMGQLEIA